jgi:hypothetical protein
LLSIFRTNQLLANILLLGYVFLVRSSIFSSSATLMRPQGILSYEIAERLGTQHWLEPILALFLVFIQGVIINFLVFKYRVTGEQSLFPGLFYILLASTLPSFLGLTSTLLAATFIILSFFELFESYRKPFAATNIFNIGMLLAIASFFQFSTAVFLFWGIICINSLRSGSIKEAFMLVTGFIAPYFLLGTVYFLSDSFDIFWNEHFGKNIAFFSFTGENNWFTIASYGFFFLLIALVVLAQSFYSSKRSMQAQKYQTILYWVLIFAGVSTLFQSKTDLNSLLLLAPPIAIFLTYNFLSFKTQVSEAIHLLWLLAVLVIQYHSFLGF